MCQRSEVPFLKSKKHLCEYISSKLAVLYPSSHNHGSGKLPPWRLKSSSRPPFSTSMIMGERVDSVLCFFFKWEFQGFFGAGWALGEVAGG